MSEIELAVERELRKLHLTGTLSGMAYLTHAIAWTVDDPGKVRSITKSIYYELSDLYMVDRSQIERTMRTAIKYSWENGGRDAMDQMIGYHLERRPTNSEFIDFVAAHIRCR